MASVVLTAAGSGPRATRAASRLWTTGAGTDSWSRRYAEKVWSSLRTVLRVAAGAEAEENGLKRN